ncbi:MAG: hypothetical protein ACK5YA_00565 [bacterium]
MEYKSDDEVYNHSFRELSEKSESNVVEENLECKDFNDCSNNGFCERGKCSCFFGYVTTKDSNGLSCNYKQKVQVTAFILELFLGFGMGHYYSERFAHATLKFFALIIGITSICMYPLLMKCISRNDGGDFLYCTSSFLFYIIAMGLAFLIIYDLMMFGLNKYDDGKGIPLKSWDD